jgi:polygalacturonase
MINKRILTGILMLLLSAAMAFSVTVDMRKAGADGAGKKNNAKLINSTIDKLHAKGGGTLYFPTGKYLTGGIRMKSNITIEISAGATLLFSDNFDDYLPFVEMRYEGVVMNSFHPLIYAVDAENITIKGEGKLDGQGKKWWDELFRVMIDLKENGVRDINKYQPMWDKANNVQALFDETNEDYTATLQRRFFRPPFIQPIRCKNVRIQDVTIVNSPFWTINPEFCENVKVTGVTIINPKSPNTDGINPSSCRNVHISDCHISVGDDCITIKSGRDGQGRRYGVPCENITITNCTMLSGHGGVVIGSEMSGSVRNVVISNCIFDGTDRGIRLKSSRGRGGVVENIRVSNIVMRNIQREAIILDLKYSRMPEEPVSERTPVFRNIHISNLTGVDVRIPIYIRGLEEAPITDITLSDINIQSKQEPYFENTKRVILKDVIINEQEIVKIP